MQSTFRYDVFRGNAGNLFTDVGTLSLEWETVQGMSRIVQISCWDANCFFRMSYDGEVWGPEIEVDMDDPPLQFPHAAREIEVRNATPGAISRYQIIGFW